MFLKVSATILKEVSASRYVVVCVDGTTTLDNDSWISIHAYTMRNFVRVPHLINLQRIVNETGANNLTSIIVNALHNGGGVIIDDLPLKLMCFGAERVSTFQGIHNGVIKQLGDKFTPYLIGLHEAAHKTNLVEKTMAELGIIKMLRM